MRESFRSSTLERMDAHVDALINRFNDSLGYFENVNPFSGPSLYFHNKAIKRRREFDTVENIVWDQEFINSLYATLVSWGMHRMGSGKTKLRAIGDLEASLHRNVSRIRSLENRKLHRLIKKEADVVADEL